MDDNFPYSELQLQAPLSSESHMHTTQPPMEQHKSSSKSDDYSKYLSVDDHSQCCASPVPYDIMKPNTTSTPDANKVYQVPRPCIKMDTESANKDQDKRLSDCSDCGNTRGGVGATGENKMEPKDSADM